jgi:hypothetical protein
MKWDGNAEKTPEFAAGMKLGIWCTNDALTLVHILYNRLRHNRPHRTKGKQHFDAGYTDYDQSFIDWMNRKQTYTVNRIISELANLGIDAKALLGKAVK